MHRSIIVAIALAALAIPASAGAVTIHQHIRLPDEGATVVQVVQVAPPDTDQDGVANTDDQCKSTAGDAAYNGCPPPAPKPVTYSSPAPVAATTAAPSTTTSSGGCPSYMAGEASSPTAVNSSSGASGCYQVLPSTAQLAGAACSDVNSTSCVAAICAMNPSDPNSPWVSSGSTPCDYIQP